MSRRSPVVVLLIFMLLISQAAGHDPERNVDVEVLAKSVQAWDGSNLPDGSQAVETEVTVLKITIAPKSTLPMHKHPVINAGYMVSGELTVHTEDGVTMKLREGQAIVELVDRWHYGVNESNRPATIVVVYVGEYGKMLSIKK